MLVLPKALFLSPPKFCKPRSNGVKLGSTVAFVLYNEIGGLIMGAALNRNPNNLKSSVLKPTNVIPLSSVRSVVCSNRDKRSISSLVNNGVPFVSLTLYNKHRNDLLRPVNLIKLSLFNLHQF